MQIPPQIEHVAGDTFAFTARLRDSANAIVPLAGFVARAHVRDCAGSLIADLAPSIVGNTIVVSVAYTITATWPTNVQLYFDLEVTNGADRRHCHKAGLWLSSPVTV